MTTILLRRRRLGRTSCREIANNSTTGMLVHRNDRQWPAGIHYGTVIRWGCTGNIPRPVRTINKASAIHEVNDKLGFRRILNEHELCPRTWFDIRDIPFRSGVEEPNYPLVVRPARHAQGRRLHVCRSPVELSNACARYPEYYISELINKVAEYRVFVVAGRVACVAQKTPGNPDDVAWNVARGGRFDNVRWGDWPLRAVKASIEAFNLSSLDFGGVDVMVDEEGKPYILEINSAPSLTSPYRQACMAKALDYTIMNGTDRIPLVDERGGWRKFIHPALSEEALTCQ